MPWDQYLKEGFEPIDRMQAESIDANFIMSTGQYPGIQLELLMRVDAIESPPDSALPETYHLWYSIGNLKNGWVIEEDGARIWNPNPEAGVTKTSKMGMLIQRAIELNAPMVNSDVTPTDKRAWIGINGIWVREVTQRRGLDDSDITLPEQLFGVAQAPVPIMVHANGNGASAPVMAPQAPSAPAPMAPQAPAPVGVFNWHQYWGADDAVWTDYIRTLVKGSTLEQAKTKIMADVQLQADSTLTTAVADGSFWGQIDFLHDVGGVLV